MLLAGLALLLPLSPLATPSPSDEGFRCPSGRLVSIGDRLTDVRERCGDPDSSEKRTETRRRIVVPAEGASRPEPPAVAAAALEDIVTVEEWSYDLGEGRLRRHLRFENGRLVEVRTGSRQQPKPPRP